MLQNFDDMQYIIGYSVLLVTEYTYLQTLAAIYIE